MSTLTENQTRVLHMHNSKWHPVFGRDKRVANSLVSKGLLRFLGNRPYGAAHYELTDAGREIVSGKTSYQD